MMLPQSVPECAILFKQRLSDFMKDVDLGNCGILERELQQSCSPLVPVLGG